MDLVADIIRGGINFMVWAFSFMSTNPILGGLMVVVILGGGFLILVALACYGFQMLRLFFDF